MKKTVLITGIAGLLGGRLAKWLKDTSPEVKIIGIDDLSGGYVENIPRGVKWYMRNLVTDDIDDIFANEKIDYVFHFAAYASECLSPFIRSYNYQNNLVATTKIVNQCIKHGIERLVFTSSMAVYGHGGGKGCFDETQQPEPIDPYGIAKYACEMDIKVAGEQHGLDWCIIRPHNVYGIGQNIWDKYRNVLGIWMYYTLHNQPITIFGDGKQRRAFSFIDDSLQPLWNAAISPKCSKQIINLGGIKDYSIDEASDILLEVVGGGEKIYLEGRHEVKHAFSTYQKSIDFLGFEHKTDLKEGLTKMWEWAKIQDPFRERFEWEEFELDKNLYSFWK